MKKLPFLAACVLLAASAQVASSATILDTTSITPNSSFGLNTFPTQQWFAGIQVDAGTPTAAFESFTVQGKPGFSSMTFTYMDATLTGGIFADDLTTELADFNEVLVPASLGSGSTPVTFTAVAPINLVAGNNYWFKVAAANSNGGSILGAISGSPTMASGYTYLGVKNGTGTPYSSVFSNATISVVPEPTTHALLLAAGLCGILRLRRKAPTPQGAGAKSGKEL